MKTRFADDVLDRHRELWAAARRADAEGGRYLQALESGDAADAERLRDRYRDQLLAIAATIRALDGLLATAPDVAATEASRPVAAARR